MKNSCLICGRKSTKKFKTLKKDIYLCPFCSYEITIQTAVKNYSIDYLINLMKAIRNRKETQEMKDE